MPVSRLPLQKERKKKGLDHMTQFLLPNPPEKKSFFFLWAAEARRLIQMVVHSFGNLKPNKVFPPQQLLRFA